MACSVDFRSGKHGGKPLGTLLVGLVLSEVGQETSNGAILDGGKVDAAEDRWL